MKLVFGESQMHGEIRHIIEQLAPDLREDFLAQGFDKIEWPGGPLAVWLHKNVSRKVMWLEMHQNEILHFIRAGLSYRA